MTDFIIGFGIFWFIWVLLAIIEDEAKKQAKKELCAEQRVGSGTPQSPWTAELAK